MLSRRQHTKDKNISGNNDRSGELLRHLGMFTQLADEGIGTFDLKGTMPGTLKKDFQFGSLQINLNRLDFVP